MSEKRPKKAPKSPKICAMCTNTPKPSNVAQNPLPRAPSPPATPHFLWFPSRNTAQRDAGPPYHWSLGGAGAQPGPRTAGANGGSKRVPGAKKMIFSKVVPRPLGMLKQVFLARFEPVVAGFGPWKIPKCLENGPLWDQKCVKNGSKTRFSKSGPRPFGMLKQVVLPHFEPVAAHCIPPAAQGSPKDWMQQAHLQIHTGPCQPLSPYTSPAASPWRVH